VTVFSVFLHWWRCLLSSGSWLRGPHYPSCCRSRGRASVRSRRWPSTEILPLPPANAVDRRAPCDKKWVPTHTPYQHARDNLSSYIYFCPPTPCLLCPYLSPKETINTVRKKAVRFRAFELSAAAAVSVLRVCYLRAAAAEFTYRLRAKMAAGRWPGNLYYFFSIIFRPYLLADLDRPLFDRFLICTIIFST